MDLKEISTKHLADPSLPKSSKIWRMKLSIKRQLRFSIKPTEHFLNS